MAEWSFACPDWEQRLRAGRSLVPELPLDRQEAARAVGIFNRLRLSDVPETPALEIAAGDWFRDIARALLGSIDSATGMRMVREVFCLVPKKNSKTSYGALLVLAALLMNKRPRAEFLFTGPTQAVSELAFSQVLGAIELDPFLTKRLHLQVHLKTITDRKTQAQLKIKTFDAAVLTGVKPAGVLVDELHEVAKNPRASRIIGQLRGGLLPNPEGFLVFITTQSDDVPVGAFKSELQKARAIRDGKQTGAMLPVLYEFPLAIAKDQEKWSQSKYWAMVTPNAGRSITVERLIPDFETARDTGAEELRRWASQHLNIEIGLGLHTDRWAGADQWEAAELDGELTLEGLIERCDVLVAGIDGGGLDDLLGLGVIGREKQTRRWLHWGHAWAHRSVLERRKDIASRLEDFEKAGELTIVDTPGQDVSEIVDVIEQLERSGGLAQERAIGVDPVGIAQIIDELVNRGIAADRIVGISQGWKLSGAIKTAERGLADGSLVHAGQALMAWSVGNAKVEPRGNAITITKQTAGSAKIDPLMALFDAVALMAMNPEAARSVYDQLAESNEASSDGEAAPPDGEAELSEDEEMKILRDPSHPRWQEARERFEARLSQNDDETL